MDKQLHIIIASDRGNVVNLPISKKKILVATITSITVFLILSVASIYSFSLYTRNRNIANQLSGLQQKLHTSTELVAENKKLTEKLQNELDQKVARLELHNIEQANAFKLEKESLISTAVDELNERSEIIERIIGNIGIKIPQIKNGNHNQSGGPFIQLQDAEYDNLLFRADKYVQTIQCLPLGKPVRGSISSGFGKRQDPMNHRSAYHTGIDFRGRTGERVHATADGVVKKAFRNGGYGNYVLIDHGNGYTSSYAHLQKYLVHRGDRVERGQVIGLLGNTGRSTGSHLHYEIALDRKPINPAKFLKVSSLAKSIHLYAKKKVKL